MKCYCKLIADGFIDIQSRNIVGFEKFGKKMAGNMFYTTKKLWDNESSGSVTRHVTSQNGLPVVKKGKILISSLTALFFSPISSIDLTGFLQIWDGSLSYKTLLSVVQKTAEWQKVSRERSCKASLAQWRMKMTKIRLWSLGDENSTYTYFILPDVLLWV